MHQSHQRSTFVVNPSHRAVDAALSVIACIWMDDVEKNVKVSFVLAMNSFFFFTLLGLYKSQEFFSLMFLVVCLVCPKKTQICCRRFMCLIGYYFEFVKIVV